MHEKREKNTYIYMMTKKLRTISHRYLSPTSRQEPSVSPFTTPSVHFLPTSWLAKSHCCLNKPKRQLILDSGLPNRDGHTGFQVCNMSDIAFLRVLPASQDSRVGKTRNGSEDSRATERLNSLELTSNSIQTSF